MFEKERKKFREFIGGEGFLGVNSEKSGFLGRDNSGMNAGPATKQETPTKFAELNMTIQKRFFRNWR